MGIFTRDKPAPPDIDTMLGQVVDRRRDGLYDRVRLPAGDPTPREIACFQVPVGHLAVDGKVRTYSDTNLFGQGSQLPVPIELIIRRFLFVFQPSNDPADVNAFLASYVWGYWLLQKRLQQAPVLQAAVKGEMKDLVRNFGAEDCKGTIERLAVPFSYNLGDSAIFLPPLCFFVVKLEGEPIRLRRDLDFYVILDGTMDWPVQ
jgi:hypothetical protein